MTYWCIGRIPQLFHDFPLPQSFAITFQAWKIPLLNSMTFQDAWEH